jgi:general secretion pathway protein G
VALRQLTTCVCVLLAAVAALLYTAPRKVIDLKIDRAFVEMQLLRQTIDLFHVEHHRFPSADRGLLELTHGSSPFIKRLPRDPWGRPYVYHLAGDGGTYSLYSTGLNGLDEAGAGDDVTTPEKSYSCTEYGLNCAYTLKRIAFGVASAAFLASLIVLIGSIAWWIIRRARHRV